MVSATRDQVKNRAATDGQCQPKRQTTAAERMRGRQFDDRIAGEIGAPQFAHRPRSNSQLRTGMFCWARIGASQPGQAERGTIRS